MDGQSTSAGEAEVAGTATAEHWACSPRVAGYCAAVTLSTGLSLQLHTVGKETAVRIPAGGICRLVNRRVPHCARCRAAVRKMMMEVGEKCRARFLRCFTGVRECVMAMGGSKLDSVVLSSGPVLDSPPTADDLRRLLERLRSLPDADVRWRVEQAYLGTPVIPRERVERIMLGLACFVACAAEEHRQTTSQSSTPGFSIADRVATLVAAHSAGPITPGGIAAQLHMSLSHLGRIFRDATGVTLEHYLTDIHVTNACTLLADPKMNITEVAFASGFGSIVRFNAAFRRHTGMAPREYRRMLR